MIHGKDFRQVIDKFLGSPDGRDARVQVMLPNGKFMDIVEICLLENKIVGSGDSHRLVFRCGKSKLRMSKIIGKL